LQRVAVTGLGVISPIGNCVEELLSSLRTGRSGVRRLDHPLGSRLRSPIGAPVSLGPVAHLDEARLRMLDRVSRLALIAAGEAIADAGLDLSAEPPERCGVAAGCGMGGAQSTDEGYRTLYAEDSDRI